MYQRAEPKKISLKLPFQSCKQYDALNGIPSKTLTDCCQRIKRFNIDIIFLHSIPPNTYFFFCELSKKPLHAAIIINSSTIKSNVNNVDYYLCIFLLLSIQFYFFQPLWQSNDILSAIIAVFGLSFQESVIVITNNKREKTNNNQFSF